MAWQVFKNDLTSIYGQHYGPTRDEADGEAISIGGSFTKPIHVFIKRNVDSVFKIGIRPDGGTDTLNKVSITGALGGTAGPTVGIIEDDFYVDERQAITNGVIAPFITPVVQVDPNKNFICWLAFRNLTDDIRKDYNLQIVINDTETFDLVITNFQVLKEYKTIEHVYSDRPLVDKITEDTRLHTVSNIDALQLGLIPYWIQDLRYEKTWVYYKDEKDEVLHDPFYNTIGIRVGNIPNNTLLNTEAPRFFDINIFDEYKIDTLRRYVRPFLIFVNRVFISWDRIRIVKSDDQIFFAITGIDSEEIITSLDILMLPDEALYVQKDGYDGWNPRADYTYLFCFTMDGRMGGMDIFVYVRDPTVRGIVYHQSQYRDEILDIKFDQKLTPHNFFVFDDDGYLCKNYDIEIKNGNVFTLNAGAVEDYRVSIILSTQSNYSNSHITQGRFNPAFAQNVIANKKMWAEFDMTKDRLMKDFDYQYSKALSYDDNLQNAYDYTWDHNVKHYDFVPWFYRPINRQVLDPARILAQLRAAGEVKKDVGFTVDVLASIAITKEVSFDYTSSKRIWKDIVFDFMPKVWVGRDLSFDVNVEEPPQTIKKLGMFIWGWGTGYNPVGNIHAYDFKKYFDMYPEYQNHTFNIHFGFRFVNWGSPSSGVWNKTEVMAMLNQKLAEGKTTMTIRLLSNRGGTKLPLYSVTRGIQDTIDDYHSLNNQYFATTGCFPTYYSYFETQYWYKMLNIPYADAYDIAVDIDTNYPQTLMYSSLLDDSEYEIVFT